MAEPGGVDGRVEPGHDDRGSEAQSRIARTNRHRCKSQILDRKILGSFRDRDAACRAPASCNRRQRRFQYFGVSTTIGDSAKSPSALETAG